jgi:hypothetical protein
MIRRMRRFLLLLALAAGLAVPMAALGQDSPSPAAVSACRAEAAQIGNDAFVAKYGPAEPWGHCYALHSSTSSDDAASICKAEYLQLGADGFAQKYGTPETYGNCLAAHGATTTPTTGTTTTTEPTTPPPPPKQPGLDGVAKSLAAALCQTLAKQHGKANTATCVAKARAIITSCETSTTTKDAFKACVVAALAPKRR